MSHRTLFIWFLVAILIDILNKNVYLAFLDAHTSNEVYWIGQSVSFLAYIIFIRMLASKLYSMDKNRWTFILKIAALNWIGFAVNDLFDELFGTYTDVVVLEYFAFIITIPLTILEWRKYIRKT